MSGQTLGWYTAPELLGLFVIMALAIAALLYNRRVARVLANFTGGYWPPGGLIREDRPDKIAEQRELHATAVIMCRGLILFMGVGTLAACAAALAVGPE